MSLEFRQLGPRSSLHVGAPTAVNGLGLDAHQTWALWRAQISAFVESPFTCRNGRRATMALNRTLPTQADGPERARMLTVEALRALQPLWERLSGAVPCLAIATGDAGWVRRSREVARAAADAAMEYLGEQGLEGALELHSVGHAGMALALLRAVDVLEAGRAELAIVGGVDTYHDPALVEKLLLERRLFDLEDLDTFIPGEGAAFFVVGSPSVFARAGVRADARLESVAVAAEPAPMLSRSDAPSSAKGLTYAMKALTWHLREDRRQLGWIFGDMTNETYRILEYQLAFPRALAPGGLDDLGASFVQIAKDDIQVDFIPERFGDLGAATMATSGVIALESFRRGAPVADNCLLFGSSPTGARGAVLLSAIESRGRGDA